VLSRTAITDQEVVLVGVVLGMEVVVLAVGIVDVHSHLVVEVAVVVSGDLIMDLVVVMGMTVIISHRLAQLWFLLTV